MRFSSQQYKTHEFRNINDMTVLNYKCVATLLKQEMCLLCHFNQHCNNSWALCRLFVNYHLSYQLSCNFTTRDFGRDLKNHLIVHHDPLKTAGPMVPGCLILLFVFLYEQEILFHKSVFFCRDDNGKSFLRQRVRQTGDNQPIRVYNATTFTLLLATCDWSQPDEDEK